MKGQSLVLRRPGLLRVLLLTIATTTALAWIGVASAQNAAKTAVEAEIKAIYDKRIVLAPTSYCVE